MKVFFSSVFWISVALCVAFWGLYVVDMTSYARMGNIHELGDYRIEIEGSRDEVFEKVSGIKAGSPTVEPAQEDGVEAVTETEIKEPAATKTSFKGETMLELPGFQEFGSASVLLVEHRLPDFLMYQERYQKVIFIHGLGFEELRPGVTELTWRIQSPNTQWWFHGFVMHPALYLWERQISQVLKNIKEKLENG